MLKNLEYFFDIERLLGGKTYLECSARIKNWFVDGGAFWKLVVLLTVLYQ